MSTSTPTPTTTEVVVPPSQQQTPSSSSSSTLECGTSLSERAHYYYDVDDDDDEPKEDQSKEESGEEEKKESNSNESSTTTMIIEKREAHKAKMMMMSKMMMKDGDGSASTGIKNIHDLRSIIASDVLGCKNGDGKEEEGALLQFSSPFEDMFEKQRLKQQQQQQQNKKHYYNSNAAKYSLPLIYCDQTASNRPISSIETYLQQVCLPLMGNTHTNTSITGSQSTAFCAEARQLIAELTNAKITGKASTDIVLFA